eukprot:gene38810-47929_t
MSARLFTLAAIASAAFAANVHDRAFYEEKFFTWMSEHKITATDGNNFVQMIQNFANNHDLVESTNAMNLSYKLGHNQFSAMSPEEYKKYVKGVLPTPVASEFTHNVTDVKNLASSINWVTAGAVTDGAYYNKYKSLQSFSEQHLVDCDTSEHILPSKTGCDGGVIDKAFAWVTKNGGIALESDYVYTSGVTKVGGKCVSQVGNKQAAPTKYVDLTKNSDEAMTLNVGPVSVTIQADEAAFQLYKPGVFAAACGTSLDHAVLAVG